MFKKVMVKISILLICFSLFSCGEKNKETSEKEPEKKEEGGGCAQCIPKK